MSSHQLCPQCGLPIEGAPLKCPRCSADLPDSLVSVATESVLEVLRRLFGGDPPYASYFRVMNAPARIPEGEAWAPLRAAAASLGEREDLAPTTVSLEDGVAEDDPALVVLRQKLKAHGVLDGEGLQAPSEEPDEGQ